MSQHWPLSQQANKSHGKCSHCLSTCQLHLKDNSVHLHGPRASRCPGSNKPPLGVRVPSGGSPIFSSSKTPSLQSLGRLVSSCSCSASPNLGSTSELMNKSTSMPASLTRNRSGTLASVATNRNNVSTANTVNHPPLVSGVRASGTAVLSQFDTNTTPATLTNSNDIGLSQPHVSNYSHSLFHPSLRGPVVKHIPKSARPACCTSLTGILNSISVSRQDISKWEKLLSFCPSLLLIPRKDGCRSSISDIIKSRAAGPSVSINLIKKSIPSKRKAFDIAKAVSSKIEDGNVKGAYRLLCSDDKPAGCSEAALAAMHARHPLAPTDRVFTPVTEALPSLRVSEDEIIKAIKSFPAGSSGGPDGFTPQHLLELVTCQSGGSALLSALTSFVNLVLDGGCPTAVRPVFFGARLIALEKKSGGFRPIAIGYTLRRLVAKCANSFALKKLADYFCPIQLGVAVSGGCEAAVHASRRFLEGMGDGEVLVKLDFSNAFNTIRRDAVLNAVAVKLPELYRFCSSAYSDHSTLTFGDRLIQSQEGVQQGDPLGPLLFCLTLQPILNSLSSKLRVGYLDDVTLGGKVEVVNSDVSLIMSNGNSIGLQLNQSKCEIISLSNIPPELLIGKFTHLQPTDSVLLGAPLMVGAALDEALSSSCSALSTAACRLSDISAHDALVLLKSCVGTSNILHILRSSPCSGHPSLTRIDGILRQCVSHITNTTLSDDQWAQAALPVKAGGLGIRSASQLAPSAYLSAFFASSELQALILSLPSVQLSHHEESALTFYSSLSCLSGPPQPFPTKQKIWDKAVVNAEVNRLLLNQADRARLLAVSAEHSSDWLNALPISNCGLRLSDEAIRVAVGLRLGASLCSPHQCPCGSEVNSLGTHGLSCKKNGARIQRHNAVNDIIHRALVRAGVPSIKEPPGMLRSDGKRPDGATQIPWAAGRCLVWDVTVVDTLAPSYASLSSISAGKAAERAAENKVQKYSALCSTHFFQPIAMETLGPFNSSASLFVSQLGKRLTSVSGDRRESSFLFQRLSVTLQRFNEVAFCNSFPSVLNVSDDVR